MCGLARGEIHGQILPHRLELIFIFINPLPRHGPVRADMLEIRAGKHILRLELGRPCQRRIEDERGCVYFLARSVYHARDFGCKIAGKARKVRIRRKQQGDGNHLDAHQKRHVPLKRPRAQGMRPMIIAGVGNEEIVEMAEHRPTNQ